MVGSTPVSHARGNIATLTMLLAMPGFAQVGAEPGDWPSYNRDLAGTRYSPLTQIHTGNVNDLREAWSYPLGRNVTTGDLGGGSQFVPLVIDGVMYLAGADRVAALEADTGEELWRYDMRVPPSRRGLAWRPGDDTLPPMLFITVGAELLAIFPEALDTTSRTMPVAYLGAPVIFEDLLLVGSNTSPGSVRAFDVRTGSQAWVFHSTPGPGEFGHDTWENDAWRDQPNLFHWAFSLTVDEERELVFAAFESAGPSDYYGGDRPGDNLFSDSIVALDVRTGERRWHYQTIHHDIWDFDLPAAPGLLDVEIDGETVPILALAGKTGYMYILNRETGEPVFGIEERPAPRSNVPGERSSPTQPIPVKPPPIAKVAFSAEDIVSADDTTEAHAQFCRRVVEQSGGFRNDGPFTPYGFRPPGTEGPSTIVFPGSIGGANWGGTAADPALGYIFVNTMNEGSFGWIEEDPAYPGQYWRNSIHGPLSRFWWHETPPESRGSATSGGESAWPCNKPPWANLVADQRGHRGYRLERPARNHRRIAARQATDRPAGHGRTHGDRRRPGVHRRHQRPALPRLRLADRGGTLGNPAGNERLRQSDHLPGARRQPVRGHRRRRRLRPGRSQSGRSPEARGFCPALKQPASANHWAANGCRRLNWDRPSTQKASPVSSTCS